MNEEMHDKILLFLTEKGYNRIEWEEDDILEGKPILLKFVCYEKLTKTGMKQFILEFSEEMLSNIIIREISDVDGSLTDFVLCE